MRRNNLEVWGAFWHVAHFGRQLSSDVESWFKMFPCHIDRLLPLRHDLSGSRQTIPILRDSGGATLPRIGGTKWRTRDFFVDLPDDSTRPFLGLRPDGRISYFG